ncbi:transposase [Streptomyces virginiae]|uniref:transposase n=1 Tax=Streptomyces virginiae TaxID=1961 RepID=UPI003803E8B0
MAQDRVLPLAWSRPATAPWSFLGGDLSQRLVPDDLRAMVEPVLPFSRSRPQGGGTAPIDQRAVFTAIVYVLISGCAWRYLSACRAQT